MFLRSCGGLKGFPPLPPQRKPRRPQGQVQDQAPSNDIDEAAQIDASEIVGDSIIFHSEDVVLLKIAHPRDPNNVSSAE